MNPSSFTTGNKTGVVGVVGGLKFKTGHKRQTAFAVHSCQSDFN
jgi:hypothetical protein